MTEKTLFWPVPREFMESKTLNSEVRQLRSMLSYQMLFGGRLAIRDSDYLNTLALRKAVITTQDSSGNPDDHDKFIRTMIDERYLLIACRDENSIGVLAEKLKKSGGSPIVRKALPTLYERGAPDLIYLEEEGITSGTTLTFSLSDAKKYYTKGIQKILSRPVGSELPDEIREKISVAVNEKIENNGYLGWEFLSKEGGVWATFPQEDVKKYGDFLFKCVGQAPHTGFIPSKLNLDTIYMKDVAKSIDLLRGRHLLEPRIIENRTFQMRKGFSFSDYAECLSVLPFESVRTLSESNKSAAFRKACLNYISSNNIDEIEKTYVEYRMAIDEEIVKFGVMRKSNPASKISVIAGEISKNGISECITQEIKELVGEEVVKQVIPFWKLGFSLFHLRATGESLEQKKLRLVKEESAAKISTLVHVVQEIGTEISGKVIFEDDGLIDRQVDLSDTCVSG